MTISPYETREMLAAIEQKPPVRTFLLATFFSGSEQHTTRHVDIDVFRGKRRMAPFVSHRSEGKVIEKQGFKTYTFTPPYIKPKYVLTAEDLGLREMGQNIYMPGNASPQALADQKVGKCIDEADEMITRREEWMAAQALNTGKITVRGEGIDADIDFLMPSAHKITLGATDLFTHADSNPITILRAKQQIITKASGIVPTDAVFGTDVVNAFLDNAKMAALLDNRRIDMGQIDPRTLPEGCTYIGFLKGPNIDIWSYEEWYQDDNGDDQPMVPVDKIFLGSRRTRNTRHYGAIQDLEATAAVRMFPKSWVIKDPSSLVVLVQSAALVAMHQSDAFMSIKAV